MIHHNSSSIWRFNSKYVLGTECCFKRGNNDHQNKIHFIFSANKSYNLNLFYKNIITAILLFPLNQFLKYGFFPNATNIIPVLRTVPTKLYQSIFVRLMTMRKKQILARAIGIQKENCG